MAEESEWERILDIYNQYPLKELIIHPRTQSDYYKNHPHLEAFEYAVQNSKCPICYNGDIFNLQDLLFIQNRFPTVDKFMLGRGLLMNPGLVEMLETGAMPEKDRIKQYHDQIYDNYKAVSYGEHNVLFKMKELWTYMSFIFEDSKKYSKKIKKAERLWSYDQAVDEIFEKCNLTTDYTFKLK
jgi:tRNA-dihydrouridine synthase